MSIRPLKTKSFNEIKNLDLSYLDKSLDFLNTSYSTAESFNFNLYKALQNFNDLTVNNYSYFFLGKKDLFTNWLKANIKENKTTGYITPIKFILEGKPAFLYFNRDNIGPTPNERLVWDTNFLLNDVESVLQLGIDPNTQLNYLFIIEFIENTNKCYIKHINGQVEYYLYNRKYDFRANNLRGRGVNDLWFTSDKELAETFGQFNYVKTDNDILFFLSFTDNYLVQDDAGTQAWVNSNYNIEKNGDTLTLRVPETTPESYYYWLDESLMGKTVTILKRGQILSLRPDHTTLPKLELVDNPNLLPLVEYKEKTYNVISSITDHFTDINDFINTSWISYKDRNLANINKDKSTYNLESQCLFHLQYNNIDNNFSTTLNIIPLKNHMSPKNFAIRGDYMNTGSKNDPNVQFREYTSIETGTNQEFGNSNITLNYVFYDIEYIINPGEDLVFSVTKNNESLGEGLKESLYPFIYLNINDTKFIKNGAFGSINPFLSDKVKKLQVNSQFVNNGRYLYTWLYQSKSNPYGIWLDRYYYPNIISKEAALKSKVNFDPASFDDIIDKDYVQNDPIFLSYIKNAPYFDKQSDLVFEPDTEYVYSRVGDDQINSILSEIDEYKESEIKSYSSEDKPVTIDCSKIKQSGVLDLNFDMYLSPNKVYGLDILSNSATNGLNISNLNDITPFIYTFNNVYDENNNLLSAVVTLHNLNFDIIKELDIQKLYNNNEEIVSLALNVPYKDFAIVTSKYVYIMSYDLILKERIRLAGDDDILQKVYISNNKLYYLIDKDYFVDFIYKGKLRHLNTINLDDPKNEIKGLSRYIPSLSKLVYKIFDKNKTNIYSVYYNPEGNEEYNNLIPEYIDDNGRQVYRAKSTVNYPLPDGLLEDNFVYINEVQGFNKTACYYSPNLDINGYSSNQINSLLIDKDGTVYAFPYILITKQEAEDLLYGVRERSIDSLYQVEIVDLNDYKERTTDILDSNIAFVSYTRIFDIAANSLGQLALTKYQSTVTENTSKLELLLFDKAKRPQRSILLGEQYDLSFGLDALKSYDRGILKNNFIIFNSKYNENSKSNDYFALLINEKYQSTEQKLNFDISSNLTACTNYSQILTEHDKSTLNFTLNIPKNSLINNQFTYSFSLKNIMTGWYNFRVIVDLNNGIFKVYENEQLLPIKQAINITPHIYNLKNVFNYPLILGTATFKNGITLNDFLNYRLKNPFDSTGIKIKNFILYSKLLTEDERQAVMISLSSLEPLTITLPGGQRNNFEEIIRYFKYNPPANISNTIRINIKNSAINRLSDQQMLSLDILRKISEELAVPLSIEEIKFV